MSENIRAAHARIKRHCEAKQHDGPNANSIPNAAASTRNALLSDLGRLPAPGSASKVFMLGEHEIGLPGVSLWVRSEEQPYLRGAINAIECLIEAHGLETLRSRGVSCQRGSPHTDEMTIAASAYDIPAYVMNDQMGDTIDGSKMSERHVNKMILAVEGMGIDDHQQLQEQLSPNPNAGVIQDQAVPFPLHHHAEVIHGQGTVSLQLEQDTTISPADFVPTPGFQAPVTPDLGAVISDIANGVTLSGICMAYSGKGTQVFGAAPSTGFWEHALERYLQNQSGQQQPESKYWENLEIPIGAVPWATFTAPNDLSAVFNVDHESMCAASLKVFEHCGLHVQPDEAAPLAVALYNEDFRRLALGRTKGGRQWPVGIVLQPRKSTLKGQFSPTLSGKLACFPV